MRVAVLGAGGVGLGTAGYLMSRSHEAVVLSPSGNKTKALARGEPLMVTGKVNGTFPIRAAKDCKDAMAGAEVVMICVPGYGHKSIIDLMAPHVTKDQLVIISSHSSFASLYLSKLLAARGIEIPIVAWATTVIMPNRTGEASVEILTIRNRFDSSTMPVSMDQRGYDTCVKLFGDVFERRPDVLQISLSNLNPPIHLSSALCMLAVIERGETWYNYESIGTEVVGRLIESLDEERINAAKAYGHEVRTAQDHFYLTHGVPRESIAAMSREIHKRRGGKNGPSSPATLDTRYITEDVPFGLVPVISIGKAAGVAMPLHEAGVALISALYGRDFRKENNILPELHLENLSAQQLHQLVREGWRSRKAA
jgi:opine dehydrogenase